MIFDGFFSWFVRKASLIFLMRTSTFFISLIIFLFALPVFCLANNTIIDRAAPDFKVIAADKDTLSLNDIRSKVAVIFYESKGAIEQNRKLKNALNEFYARQPDSFKKDIARIGVINCRGVFFRSAWEDGLRSSTLKEGITIYGDWDGKMSADYGAKDNQSNVIIIDKRAVIRYFASGEVEDGGIREIEGLLGRLVRERP